MPKISRNFFESQQILRQNCELRCDGTLKGGEYAHA